MELVWGANLVSGIAPATVVVEIAAGVVAAVVGRHIVSVSSVAVDAIPPVAGIAACFLAVLSLSVVAGSVLFGSVSDAAGLGAVPGVGDEGRQRPHVRSLCLSFYFLAMSFRWTSGLRWK